MEIYITFDVEDHSFEINTQDDSIISLIERFAMPKILNLLNDYKAKATFFTTAKFAEKSPNTIKAIQNNGHEIGCHGFDHNDYYDSLSIKKQIELMKKSKYIIENIIQSNIESFRAPALRIIKTLYSHLKKITLNMILQLHHKDLMDLLLLVLYRN